jgi:hypothetical protein
MEGRLEVTGRRGRRHKQLLDDLKETRGYWKLKEEALDRSLSRTRSGRGCGPVVRHFRMWLWHSDIYVHDVTTLCRS